MNLDDDDELYHYQGRLETLMFECDLLVKKLGGTTPTPSTPLVPDNKGVKLPKLEAPSFDGKFTNWVSFWEQFDMAIHSRTTLTDVEKLAYLRNALKDGSAKGIIEGLSTSGEFYPEAIKILKDQYNRPRLILQSHVRAILEAPALKDGGGREIRKLHDAVQQHLRALKAMFCAPPGPFITSILELKLDDNTSFEWQKFSQDLPDFPHYDKLLAFLNLRAQASEASSNGKKNAPRGDKGGSKPLTSFMANASDSSACCPLCKTEKRCLSFCPKFRSLPHDQKMSTVKSNNICMNCLRRGHFSNNCRSSYRCRKCQRSHHTLLHIDQVAGTPASAAPATPSPRSTPGMNHSTNTSHAASGSLLMTCRVLTKGPNGSIVESRALLDSASSVLFVSERLTQALRLPRSRRAAKIHGVAGLSHDSHAQSFTKVIVSPMQEPTKEFNVNAIIMPRVTCNLPTQYIPFKTEWNHLADLTLADPDFGQPGKIDLLLGVEVFSAVVRQGRRYGVSGSPSAFETDFGWVLAGETNTHISHLSLCTYHTTVVEGDDLLRKFWEIEERPNELSDLSSEERTVTRHFKDNHSRDADGRFIAPLPKKPQAKALGESRSQAVRRHRSLERSLQSK